MNFLADKIEKLLITNDCVIIESFGGFIKNRKSANLSNGIITPPKTEISFNAMLNHDDGLLSALIADESSVNYRSASTILAKHIDNLRQCLNEKQIVEFGNIGVFRLEKNSIVFSPNDADYLPENFGLKPINIVEKQKTLQIGSNIRLNGQTIEINIANLGKKVVRYAAAITILAIITLFAPNTNQMGQYAGFGIYHKNTMTVDKTRKSDSILLAYHNIVLNSQTLSTKKINTKIERLSYHIVVASFYKKYQAKQFCKENSQVFDSIKILESESGKKLYRCIIGSYASEQEAESIAIHSSNKKDYWILSQ